MSEQRMACLLMVESPKIVNEVVDEGLLGRQSDW